VVCVSGLSSGNQRVHILCIRAFHPSVLNLFDRAVPHTRREKASTIALNLPVCKSHAYTLTCLCIGLRGVARHIAGPSKEESTKIKRLTTAGAPEAWSLTGA
jgi:hypothetical protein